MGAFNDYASISVKVCPDPDDAYRTLVEEAAYEDGHSPYAGTIATSYGWREFTDFPVTDRESYLKAKRVIWDRTEKWSHYEHFVYGGEHYFIGWAAS
jgi:hypothetical protein